MVQAKGRQVARHDVLGRHNPVPRRVTTFAAFEPLLRLEASVVEYPHETCHRALTSGRNRSAEVRKSTSHCSGKIVRHHQQWMEAFTIRVRPSCPQTGHLARPIGTGFGAGFGHDPLTPLETRATWGSLA
jgi:hypothetical protein